MATGEGYEQAAEAAAETLPILAVGAPEILVVFAVLAFAAFIIWLSVRKNGNNSGLATKEDLKSLKGELEGDLDRHDEQNTRDFTRVENRLDRMEKKIDTLLARSSEDSK